MDPNYHYKPDYPSSHHDRRDRSPPRKRVSDNKSYRDFSPVRPRNRSPLQERTDHYSPEYQRQRLSQSTGDPAHLYGRVQPRALYPGADPLLRIRPLIQRSAPSMQRPSPAELRKQTYLEESQEFNDDSAISHNF